MDREKFDALARLLGAEGTRRSALGALVGAALLGAGIDAEAGRRRRRHKSRKRRNRKQQQQEKRAAIVAAQQPCFGNKGCLFPNPTDHYDGCLFPGITIEECDGCSFRATDLGNAPLTFGSFQGATFRNANLRGVDLAFANVSGANFRDACLSGTDFFGANIDGADFEGAIFCGTVMTDGQINNSGCHETTDCCPRCQPGDKFCARVACTKDTDCPEDEFCINNICRPWCTEDFQCDGGFDLCRAGRCVLRECFKDVDCSDNGINSTCCDGLCVDEQNDPDNCGTCFRQCHPDEHCALGQCIDPTPQG
jgi:hypothetical protein